MVELKSYEGQLLTCNDTVLYKVYENSSSKKTRDVLRFLSSLGQLRASLSLGGVVKFRYEDYNRYTAPPRASIPALEAFNALIASDIEELVEVAQNAGYSLDEFAGLVRQKYAEVQQAHGVRFYRTQGFAVVLNHPEEFYEAV